MKIQCNCGSFQADLTVFPRNTLGRIVCYCDDCQNFLAKINRTDLLDAYGGTEVIPVYPSDIKTIKGQEHLRCNLLSPRGLNRWSTTCCNSPIANTRAAFPWASIFHSAFTVVDNSFLDNFGPIKGRIQGKYAKSTPPFNIPDKFGVKNLLRIVPFLLKGRVLKKHKPSPFFKDDGKTPISEPFLLPK